jgi:hypothetical protein
MAGRAEDEALMGVLFGEEAGSKPAPALGGAPGAASEGHDEVEPGWGGQGLHAGRVGPARDENTESTPPTILMGGSAEARAAAIAALRADLDLGPPPAPPARVGVSVRVKVRKNTAADEEAAAPPSGEDVAPAPSTVASAPSAPSAPVAPDAPKAKAAPAKAAPAKSGGVAWSVVLLAAAAAAASWAWVTLR